MLFFLRLFKKKILDVFYVFILLIFFLICFCIVFYFNLIYINKYVENKKYDCIAQSVEQWPFKPVVVGSIPITVIFKALLV